MKGKNVTPQENINLRQEQLSLALGNIIGQLSILLNQVHRHNLTMNEVYNDLLDITKSASLQLHELYYKGNKPEGQQ